jgi:hypothetical protein
MPDFYARIRVTHPIEIVSVTAPDRNTAIADLVREHETAGDSVEVMEIKEIPPATGGVGPTGTTGTTGTTGGTGTR